MRGSALPFGFDVCTTNRARDAGTHGRAFDPGNRLSQIRANGHTRGQTAQNARFSGMGDAT